MNERSRNAIVGATALAGLMGLLTLLLLFGYIPQWAEDVYEVHVRLPSAYGLNKDSRVYLSGIDVGRVDRIDLDQSGPGLGVIATCRVDSDYRLPEGVRVELSSSFLGAGATLQFVVDEVPQVAEPRYLPTDGTAIVYGESASPVGVIAKEVRGALARPLERFDELADNLDALSTEWRRLGENLNKLAEPRSIEDVDGGDVAGNLATMIARADARLAEMQAALDGINQYVNDEQLREDIKVTAASSRQMAENLNASVEALSRRYVELADEMSVALKTTNAVLEKANAGEGTLGRLLSDPKLYDNLNDAAERLEVALEELQLLFEKMKDEGIKFKL